MNDILARSRYDSRRIEIRRLAWGTGLLLTASAVWHVIGWPVLYRVASSSIGCPGRQGLVAAAVGAHDPRVAGTANLWWYNMARPGWIAWPVVREFITHADGTRGLKWEVTVADEHLSVKGRIAGRILAVPPGDFDGDGRGEVVVMCSPWLDEAQDDIARYAVVRLREDRNEIVWAGLVDRDGVWGSRGVRVRPVWRDMDGDDVAEFVFITVAVTRLPQGTLVFKPSEVVAVFEWDSPGGMLRARSLPDNGSVVPWAPSHDRPVSIDQLADLTPVMHDLLPAS